MELRTAALASIVLLVTFQTGLAVQCYLCNSGEHYEGEACDDPMPDDKANIVDCEVEGLKDGKNYTYCRKFVQNVEGKHRIVRTCATDGRPHGDCAIRTGTHRIKLLYCECAGDLCNAASTPSPTALTLLAAAAVLSAAAAVFARRP